MKLKFLVQPCGYQNTGNTDQVRCKPEAEMKLDDAQIQEDILQIENFKSFRQIGHKSYEINPFHHLAQNAAD